MRLIVRIIILLILTFFSPNIFSQPSNQGTPESPVDLQHEPHHHLKFENKYVRVWDTLIPAHEATLWHIHSRNNVVLTLGDAQVRVETVGADPAETQAKLGDVGFRKASYVHRTMSIGDTPFHNMAIEILASATDAANPVKAERPTFLENEQVRVYRISLSPGESSGLITDTLPGLLVAITSAGVELQQKDKPEAMQIQAGDVRWREKAGAYSIKNTGKTQFDAVDIELK